MKALSLFGIAAITLVFISCSGSKSEQKRTSCIEEMITELKTKPVQNPPAAVWRWEDEGSQYYYITSDCCDQYNYLYDANCNRICAPDGGMTGQGDGKCPSFSSSLTRTLLWKDDR